MIKKKLHSYFENPVTATGTTALTSPYASGRYRGQYRERGGHELRRGRRGLGAVTVSAAHLAAERRLDELVLGRDPRTVLVQELHDYAVGPAETQLHLVLAAAAVSSWHGRVVLRHTENARSG